MSLVGGIGECIRRIVNADLVEVATRRLQLGVAHEPLQGEYIEAALPHEPIRETMAQWVRGKTSPLPWH